MFPILGTNLWCYTIALTLSLDQGTINVGTSRLSRFLPMTKNLCLRECVWIHLEQHWWSASSCSRGFLSFRKSPFLFQVLYTVLTLRPRSDLRLTDLNFIFTTKKGDQYFKQVSKNQYQLWKKNLKLIYSKTMCSHL